MLRLRLLTLVVIAALLLLAERALHLMENPAVEDAMHQASGLIRSVVAQDEQTEENTITAEETSGDEVPTGGDTPSAANDDTQMIVRAGDREFTAVEIEILQRLAQRRQVLSQWEKDLEMKENVLKLTETKIEQRLTELRDLKKQVSGILNAYNDKEDDKTQSLVKIYENMKPKNAAKIFTEMDNTTLLRVMQKMKEAKLALILANMDPADARELTERFAKFGRINSSRTN